MVISVTFSAGASSGIQQTLEPRLADQDIVDLIPGVTIRRYPCVATAQIMLKSCVTNDQAINPTELSQHVPTFIALSKAIVPNTAFKVSPKSQLGVEIAHDYTYLTALHEE